MNRRILDPVLRHTFLIAFGAIMVYPLIWLVFSSLKPSFEIFQSISLFPSEVKWINYLRGLRITGDYTLISFILNTLVLEALVIAGTLFSTSLAGFAFARIDFKLKGLLLSVLIGSLLLPQMITLIPRYILFSKLGWTNTYAPFYIPAFFGTGMGGAFFIFLQKQYIQSIPRELDESATIDGCGRLGIYLRIIMPLCKTILITVILFVFIWTWDDFQNQLIFLNETSKYTVALGLRLTVDTTEALDWGPILAACVVALIPNLVIFLSAQKYFIEGIATSGIKR